MNKLVFLCVIAFIVLLTGFVTLAPNSYAAVGDSFGCCIDTEIGCYTTSTVLEQQACESLNFDFEADVACEPSALNPDLDVTDNPVCGVSGCCCFADRFQNDLSSSACTLAGGTFSSSDNCASACGVDESPSVVTCSSLGGFWCESQPADAVDFTSSLETEIDSPGDDYSCFSRPCTADNICEPGEAAFELYCTNGVSEDQDCVVDFADSDCELSVSGYVEDRFGTRISNVEITFTNQDHEAENGFVDSFKTYSVGADGRFFFRGLSDARGLGYRAVITDDTYEGLDEVFFEVSLDVRSAEIFFTVVPRESGTIYGTVLDNESNPISGVLISLSESNYYAETNDQGYYEMPFVLDFGNPYTMLVFKEGYLPQTIQNVHSGQIRNLRLFSNSCSINSFPPIFQNAEISKGELGVTLDFVTSGCAVDEYMIYRCDGPPSLCTVFTPNGVDDGTADLFNPLPLLNLGPNDITYVDTFNLEWDHDYTYRIAGLVDGKLTQFSQIRSVSTGNVECEGVYHTGEYCEYDSFESFSTQTTVVRDSRGLFCNDANEISIALDDSGSAVQCSSDFNTQCVESNSGSDASSASCRQIESCDVPGDNFFGLFSSAEICEGSSGERFCTYDTTATTVDFCYSCQSVASCTDYKSERACDGNTCSVGACDWSETNTALGQGICVDTTKDLCSDCNDPFNAVFGQCSQDVCTQLGACSLSVLENECLDCEETTCYDYPDEASCNPNNIRAMLDPGDNSVIRGSSDQCSIQTCVWNAGIDSCFKDSDTNTVDDCEYLEQDYVFSPDFEVYTHDHCIDDNVGPTTFITLDKRNFNPGSIRDTLKITFEGLDTTSDRESLFGVQDIYFCIASDTSRACDDVSRFDAVPKSALNESTLLLDSLTFRGGVSGISFELASGKNIIRYYSKDHANNLELVKEEFFFVDTDAPDISVEIVRKVNREAHTTDAELFVTSNEPVYCYVNAQIVVSLETVMSVSSLRTMLVKNSLQPIQTSSRHFFQDPSLDFQTVFHSLMLYVRT
jgi:hypothetical protein